MIRHRAFRIACKQAPTKERSQSSQRGFALILTLSLLSLLVLVTLALAALLKVDTQLATTAIYQTQARQNALLGLHVGMGELQKLAGPDARATAMAGIAGAPASSELRHWCGVWDTNGAFLGWLASGALGSSTPALGTVPVIQLVADNTVGTRPASASAYADEEYVDAGKVPILAIDPSGNNSIVGHYAYWVGDEGVKISARSPGAAMPPGGMAIATASTPLSIARMTIAFQQFDAADAAKVLSYEQTKYLEYASGSYLTATNLQLGFHHVTLAHRSRPPAGGQPYAGQVNINTTSAVVWRSLLESFNAASTTKFGTAGKLTSAVNTIANGISASSSGKLAGGPYASVDSFMSSSLLSSALTGTNGVTLEAFDSVLRPMLTTRSDTFRIRAYGEALNPADTTRIESVAYCEAIVQRTLATAPHGLGNRFVVTYFRWLGPDDI